MHTFIDLFAGIGGFRVALERKGMKCIFSSEIDKEARISYKKNFGDVPEGDITEIPESSIPKHDILCAGFPCQAFSIAGKHNSFNDSRGRLFYEIIRIAEYHRPYILLLENVRNILSIDNGEVIRTIEGKLRDIGYKMAYSSLNASHYGIPQSRERVYFACVRDDLNTPQKLEYKEPKATYKPIYLESVLEEQADPDLFIKRDYKIYANISDDYALKPIRIGEVDSGMQGHRIYSIKGHSITLTANGGGLAGRTGLYLIKDRVRKLSKLECKRVMTFPDSHYVSAGVNGYKQLGNAIMPSMVERIYDSIAIL